MAAARLEMRFVVAYDISDHRARADVAAMLGALGVRLQRSVFDVEVDDIAAHIDKIEQAIDTERDVVQAFPQCRSCTGRQADLGAFEPAMRSHWWIV